MSRSKARARKGRSKARDRKTDYGTIVLHWTLVVSLVVAFVTGLRIASEAPDRTWVNFLDIILPRSVVWTAHMPAAVVLVTVATAYAFYIALAGLARRVRLDRVRMVGLFGNRSARWGSINIVLHWSFFATLMLQLVTGGLLYFGYTEHVLITLHWVGTWAVPTYAALHVLGHWRYGGVPQLLRMFRPAPIVAPPPPLDPIALLVQLAERTEPPAAGRAMPSANANQAPRSDRSRDPVSPARPPRWPAAEQTDRPANARPFPLPRQPAPEQTARPANARPFPLPRQPAPEQTDRQANARQFPLPRQPAPEQTDWQANAGPFPLPRQPAPEQTDRPANARPFSLPRQPAPQQTDRPANAGPFSLPRQPAPQQTDRPASAGPFPLPHQPAPEQPDRLANARPFSLPRQPAPEQTPTNAGPFPLPRQPAPEQPDRPASAGPFSLPPRQPAPQQTDRPANAGPFSLPRQPAPQQTDRPASAGPFSLPPRQPAPQQTDRPASAGPFSLPPRQPAPQQTDRPANAGPFSLPPRQPAPQQTDRPANAGPFSLPRQPAPQQTDRPANAGPFSLPPRQPAPQQTDRPANAGPFSLPRQPAPEQADRPANAGPFSLPRQPAPEQTDRPANVRPFSLPRQPAPEQTDRPANVRPFPLPRQPAPEQTDRPANVRPFSLPRQPAPEQTDRPANVRQIPPARQGGRGADGPPRHRDPIVQVNPLVVAISVAIVGAFFLVEIDRNTIDTLEVRRIDAAEVPVLDGDTSDPVWRTAPPLYVTTGQGGNFDGTGQTTIEIRAVNDGNQAYFMFAWDDPTRSLKQLPLMKKADGWHLLHDGYEIGDERAYNEDKFSVLFTTLDVILAGDRTFHAGAQPISGAPRTLSGRGLHYTPGESVYADVWEWKATSTGPSGWMDDDSFGPPLEPTEAERRGLTPYHGGFAADPGTAGYMDNFTQRAPSSYDQPLKPRRLPNDLAATLAAMGPIDLDPDHGEREDARWFMTEGESTPYSAEDDARIPIGTVIPGVIASGTFSGDRADVRCAARWAAGRWALEVTRRIDTHSQYDIPIRTGTYMRVSAFDHSQIRHTRHVRPIRLEVQ